MIDIVKIIVGKNKKIDKITSIKVRRPSDTNKGMTVYLEVVLFYGSNIYSVVNNLQNKIKEKVEYMTDMSVRDVNVSVRSLTVKGM